MSEERQVRTYEGLFLFPQSAISDLGGAVDHVHQLLERAEAEILALSKWDERRLAYDVKGNKRGLFLLAYFRAPTDRLVEFERGRNLSELLLRSMVTRTDHLTEEQILATDDRQALGDEIKLREKERATAAEDEAASAAATSDASV